MRFFFFLPFFGLGGVGQAGAVAVRPWSSASDAVVVELTIEGAAMPARQYACAVSVWGGEPLLTETADQVDPELAMFVWGKLVDRVMAVLVDWKPPATNRDPPGQVAAADPV